MRMGKSNKNVFYPKPVVVPVVPVVSEAPAPVKILEILEVEMLKQMAAGRE